MSSEKSNDSLPIQIASLNKCIEKLSGSYQDQRDAIQLEFQLLRQHLVQMNILLDRLIKVSESGSTVAASKKIVPFHTGSQEVGQLLIPPTNPDEYPTKIDVYSINSNRTIPHMTLINDGPGSIFFINAYAKNVFNEREGHLNVNDQRELFNVFEIRLRSTLPTTTIRLIEGIFRTGSTAPQTKINTENKPTIQSNEILVDFNMAFDNTVPTVDIISPIVESFPLSFAFSIVRPPLPPGNTATFINTSTLLPMPFTIPEGFIIQLFGIFENFSTDFTSRGFIELIPGIFTPTVIYPASNRGFPINEILNLSFFSSQFFDPLGAPPGGRRFLLTITNDDPFNNMIGTGDVVAVLSRIT